MKISKERVIRFLLGLCIGLLFGTIIGNLIKCYF